MKISPVQGTPTIPHGQQSGMSMEKLQRIKSIAMGAQKEGEAHEETAEVGKVKPTATKSIKMQTNKTPEQPEAVQQVETKPEEGTEITHEKVDSDASVQTNPEPEATQQVSPQVAALAKQKRALQVKERELAEREKALETKPQGRAELEQRVKAGQALSVLEDLGITYDQLTNELLNKQNAPDLNKVQEEVLKKVDEKFKNNESAQEEAVFSHMKRNIDKLTYSSDNFPFVKAGKGQEKALELIKRAWKEDGEIVDEEEALTLIEAELKEEARTYAKLLKEPEETKPVAAETSQKEIQQRAKTLTNRDSARPQSTRRQRALAAFLGQK